MYIRTFSYSYVRFGAWYLIRVIFDRFVEALLGGTEGSTFLASRLELGVGGNSRGMDVAVAVLCRLVGV